MAFFSSKTERFFQTGHPRIFVLKNEFWGWKTKLNNRQSFGAKNCRFWLLLSLNATFTLPGAKASRFFMAVVKKQKKTCVSNGSNVFYFIFPKNAFFIILTSVVLLAWLTQLACPNSGNPLALEPTADERQIGGLWNRQKSNPRLA